MRAGSEDVMTKLMLSKAGIPAPVAYRDARQESHARRVSSP
jgi:hypothetical protein